MVDFTDGREREREILFTENKLYRTTNTCSRIQDDERRGKRTNLERKCKKIRYSRLLRKNRDDACPANSANTDCARDLEYT